MKSPVSAGLLPTLLLLGGALLVGCARETEAPPAPRAAVVHVQPVVYSAEAVPVRAAGILSRRAEVELSFKVGGIIETVAVRAGDAVKQGDVLARLRPDEIEAQVVQARSALEKARRDLERVKRLREGSVATMENAQDAETAVEVAAAGLRIAEFNRDHASIVAPADGRILRRTAEPGELASPGHVILAFGSDEDGWIVRAGLSERDVTRVRVGDRAELADEDFPVAETAAGRVTHIADAADPATRTTEVEIGLEAALPSGRSGYVIAVVLHPADVPERPVVPASAIIEGTDRHGSVFILDAGSAKVRRVGVEVGEIDRGRVFLRTPLPRDARVVTAGAEYLLDGMAVEVAAD